MKVAYILLSYIFTITTVNATGFRAAVVKIDVTPQESQILAGYAPRKSIGVHDRIHHRMLLLDDGAMQFLLISSEFSSISPAYYGNIAKDIYQQYGIRPENIWWSLTHTHSAPDFGPRHSLSETLWNAREDNDDRAHLLPDPQYTALVEQKLFEGIEEVLQKLEPAKLAVGWGFSQANINRRARDIDNKITLGMDPDGAVDRRIGLLRLDRVDGSPLALVANYAMHGTVLGSKNLEISGDAPGIVADYIEQKLGAPMLFINGAAGNLAPIYSQYNTPEGGHLNQFRVLLGDRILEANRTMISSTNNVTLTLSAISVVTPRRAGLGWPNDLSDYSMNDNQGIPQVIIPIRFLRINKDIVIWAAPLELFCEISNEIRDRSPFHHTFYFGYTNGWLGYLSTKSELKLGGYESTVHPFGEDAARDITEAVLAHLHGLPRSPEPPIFRSDADKP